MSIFFTFSLALIFLFYLPLGCANAQTVDLSTDEGMIAEVQKAVDAKNAESALGDEKLLTKLKATRRLNTQNVCIERLKESAKIIVIGFFRNDYGCHFEGAFVNSRYYAATEIELHKNALDALGWQKANRTEREKLARIWVEKGLLAFFTVLYTDRENLLRNVGFHPPEIVSTEKGDVKATLWIRLPPGRSREKGFQQVEYRFNEDGSFSGSSTLAAVVP